MDRVNWEERVKAIPADMNALHENTELTFAELIEAMAGNLDTVLFKDAPPVVTVGASLVTTIPEQWFAVDGIFCKVPVSVDTRGLTPDYISIYFVAYRTDVTGVRDRYTLAGGVVTVAPDTVIVRKPSNCRIEIVTSGNPLTPPGPPSLGPNDIGYLKYCDIVWTGIGTPTVTHNVGALWSFPGAGITYTPHAPTHLPAGSDPIQLAGLGGDPLGSRPGLMPSGSYATLMGAVQDVLINVAAPFMTRSLSGDNSPGDPKLVTLNMLLDESLTVREVSAIKRLALNFRSGGYSGTDERAARYDHRHTPGESPIAVEFYRLDVDSGDLGSELAVPAFASLARIQTTQVFWLPPLSNDDPYPLFDCSWILSPSGTIGVRAHIIDGNEIVIETGGQAYTVLSSLSLVRAVAAVGGSATWTFASYNTNPTSGHLLVKVVGER